MNPFRRELLEAEASSAAHGLCTKGHFDVMAEPYDETWLRRALDFFSVSFGLDGGPDIAIYRALITYLRGISSIPIVLTMGWYELNGRRQFEHSRSFAVRAIEGRARDPKHPLPVHAWLTSHALEIIDVTNPELRDPTAHRHKRQETALYCRCPCPNDHVIYHPTAIVEDLSRLY